MTAISSASSANVYQAPPAPPPAAQHKVDSDGDHDNSPPSNAAKSSTRALNVVA